MAFITPIINRTLADATYAMNNQGSALELKGALNISDLNRIEKNTYFLEDKLLSYGYGAIDITRKNEDWVKSDLLYIGDIDRIRQNVINLVDGYNAISGSPVIIVGDVTISYVDINSIEQFIYNTNLLLDRMIAYFRKSGTFKSGQGVILP